MIRNHIGIGFAWRHEIDVANRASARVQIGLRIRVSPRYLRSRFLIFLRREPPFPFSGPANNAAKQAWNRIAAGKPIDTTIATDERPLWCRSGTRSPQF